MTRSRIPRPGTSPSKSSAPGPRARGWSTHPPTPTVQATWGARSPSPPGARGAVRFAFAEPLAQQDTPALHGLRFAFAEPLAQQNTPPEPRTSETTVPYREEMERTFGTSFAGVATHLGEQEALAPFGARAAAWSETVAFASQAPERAVVAHELAHIEQLRRAGGPVPSNAVGTDHPAEREAAQIAAAVHAGATSVQATAAPGGAVAFDRGQHGDFLPVVASQRIENFSILARKTIYDIDHHVNPLTLLRDVEHATPAELYRWALELQSVPHAAYSNYLRAWYYAVVVDEPARALAIGQHIADRGVDFGVSAGGFTSFEHTDPKEPLPTSMAPDVARLPIGRGVDFYQSVKYDSSYRAIGGRLSTILQLRYADGATLDLDFELISDNVEPAQFQAIARSYVGPAGRVFPLRLDRATTPRLYVAKQAALKKIAEENLDFENFVSIGLAGVMSNLPVGPVVGPEPTQGSPTATPRRAANRPPVADRTPEPAVTSGGAVHETHLPVQDGPVRTAGPGERKSPVELSAKATIRERLTEYYKRLRAQPDAKNAEEGLRQVRDTLDHVENDLSGVVKKDPPPPPNASDGRMYPPLDDFVIRHPDGSITANTRGHKIEISADGGITIMNKKTGEIELKKP